MVKFGKSFVHLSTNPILKSCWTEFVTCSRNFNFVKEVINISVLKIKHNNTLKLSRLICKFDTNTCSKKLVTLD